MAIEDPRQTGNKATVMMRIDVMVEVNETNDWNDMVRQAKEQLRRRVVEAQGFYPYRSRCETIHGDVKVEELKHHTTVHPAQRW